MMGRKTRECGFDDQDLLLYHYRDLTPGRMAALEDHLATCAACRESMDRIAGTLAVLAADPAADPAAVTETEVKQFTSRIMDRVRRQDRWFPAGIRNAALAAVAVAGIMLGIFYQQASVVERQIPAVSRSLSAEEEMIEQLEFLQAMELLEEMEIIMELAAF